MTLLGLFPAMPLSAQEELVPLFTETFDSGATLETKATVPLTSLGWNLHHSFKGVFIPGRPTGNAAPNDTFVVNTTAELGDQTLGQPYGYQAVFMNNTPLYGPGADGARPELPGPHPVTGQYYSNRTLAVFMWKEATISAAARAGIREFNFVQGNRDAIYHQFFPAVRIGDQWFVYRIPPEALAAVRVFGRASQYGMYGEEGVFSGSQFAPDPMLHYTAQPYKFTWSETGWTPLTFNGGNGTNSTTGMTLGEPLAGELPSGDITAVGVYSPENIDPDGPSAPGYNFNGHRIDSIQVLGIPVVTTPDLFAFTFNNEGKVSGIDRPIQAASWNGIYSAAALPLVTGPAVFADLSEGVTDDATPGSYKAGFLFVSGKTDQPAPGGFLVWSEKTSVVDVAQDPISGVNPQTDWYSELENPVTNLAQLLAKELDTLTMRIRPRNGATVRYHFAIKVGGAWYVSQEAFSYTNTDDTWQSVSLGVQSANWLAGVVGANSLNLDFAANPPAVVKIADIGPGKSLDTVGIYIDTDANTGQTDTWARIDSITLSVNLSSEVIPPTITKQPEAVALLEGNDASFSVEVLESAVTYQWRKGGEPIDGATSATLAIINATTADAGTYDVVVTGAKGSVTSDPATLTVYPLPTVDPLVINADATLQDQFIIVDAVPQVSWTAQSQDDWIMVMLGASGSGSDLVQINIGPNTSYEPRTGTVLVAYRTVTVNQAGKPLPADFQEVVGGVAQGGGKYVSPWFGTYWVSAGTDWIYHAEHGWLYTDAVQVPESMWLYSNSLAEWVYTDKTAYPWMYDNGSGHWIYFVVAGNALFVFDSTTGVWTSVD